MSNEPRSTRAQRQAAGALAAIQVIRDKPPKERKEYKARADNFPVLVLQAGLAQAVGFMRAKAAKSPAYERYLGDLAEILGMAGGEALQQRAIDAGLPDYRQLTRDTLAAAGWLKRFGQAYLSDKEGTP
ncbi:type III-B CRISPR module-associated protein Cmr5 [Accumulibacter sp.]|uniref:type III-B CRISPR module-associated protein Cmr5 n=1 Tax=Accumulibacter sp. TaxID=2053492 RepID=UPI0025F597E3|nr:type III-B CRISPR module-associated protein Cmr5 [Accumulibacter sp.]MCM8611294.1 type III-B CRISPR module-associated protein Cmr5 [Accumulibacter sp.]MCM8635059.1 type III-B CRISPR module-associated protein Cmr5 [Accumulibacter sp.]MCM8639847.1 type III-B CRISPR module-associated protein Cmr5 [Accumulibacter sp.]